MRLGGPIFAKHHDVDSWVQAVKQTGYRAVVCPLKHTASDEEVAAYKERAKSEDILIAEVGIWNNPIHPDEQTRKQALDYCKQQLDLAERIGAACCVNIAGSSAHDGGPHEHNFNADTYALIVDTTREIIDAINPQHTHFALEMMPWIVPDTADVYLQLIKDIDRDAFAVHFDPVNIITNPRLYYNNAELITECVQKLGPYIKSTHAKDIIISRDLTVHLDETMPGKGQLNYKVFLTQLNKLNPELPIIMEHLSSEEEYKQAAQHIRSVAQELNIQL